MKFRSEMELRRERQRARVLLAVQASPGLTMREIARACAMSEKTAKTTAEWLELDGRVRIEYRHAKLREVWPTFEPVPDAAARLHAMVHRARPSVFASADIRAVD